MNADEIKKQAEGMLFSGKEKAASFLEDGGKMDQLLAQVESKLETVPKAGEYLADIPRMISLLKDHMQKDYTETPTKSLVLIVAALLYLVNPKDIIPDKYLGVGLIDDAAVMAVCIKLTKKDLDDYDAWRKAKATGAVDGAVEVVEGEAEAAEAPAEEVPAAEEAAPEAAANPAADEAGIE